MNEDRSIPENQLEWLWTLEEAFRKWGELLQELRSARIPNYSAEQKKMVNLWRSSFCLSHQDQAETQSWAQFYAGWNEECMRAIFENLASSMPEPAKNLFSSSWDVCSLWQETNQKFSEPWLDEAENLTSLLLKILSGDPEAYLEFNRIWNEKFSVTFGKFLTVPEFSLNQDIMHRQLHSLKSSINYLNSLNRFAAVLARVNQETLQKVIVDYQQMLGEGTNPKSYKEFYEYWLRQNEIAYHNLFGTDEFSVLIAQLLNAQVDFKRDLDNSLEKQLKFLPFPTKTDMDSVYKTLDDLRRTVRSLDKEMTLLREELTRRKNQLEER